jgi:aminocarboxymuconate-semialdehyde decarboxylase
MICAHGVPLHPLSEVNKLADRINSDDLDGAIVSVPPLFRPDLDAKDCCDYAELVNDGLYEACRSHDYTLRPLAYLPVEAPEVAASVAGSLDARWAGVVMGTETGVISYASAELDPLWQILSEKKLPLFIHPGSTSDKRLDPFYLTNLLGNPVKTTIAASNLIFAGVMYRFPGLNVSLAHDGGCLAALCGRWQRSAVTNRPGIAKLMLEPKDAVRRFYVDSLVHSPAILYALIKIFADDRILLGSDWPFPMGAPNADHELGHLDEALRRRIRKSNAEQAFGNRLKYWGQVMAKLPDNMPKLDEILVKTDTVPWREKSLKGISEKMLWRNEETGASIALIKFAKGAGIPQPHFHSSNQFMFCLSGRYEYTSTGVVLTAGSFYCNPKGNVHGPAVAHEETVVVEIYDGPHYPEKPSWYTDERDAR